MNTTIVSAGSTPQKESQTQREFNELAKTVENLLMTVNQLEKILQPILTNIPSNSSAKAEENENLVPIAEEIRTHRRKIQEINEKIYSINVRVGI